MRHVTFVIVTYRSVGVIGDCLASLASIPDSSVVIVDNGSDDGTVHRCTDEGVKLISNSTNRGFAVAANVGARAAEDGLICFLNPDCTMTPALVEEARAKLAGKGRCCAVPHIDLGGHLQAGRQPGYTWRKLTSDVLDTSRRAPTLSARLKASPAFHDRRWYWPLGTCLFVARRTFLDLGGFDEAYFVYMEDVEFGLALRARGGSVIQLERVVAHIGAKGADIDRNARLEMLDASRILFARRHHGQVLSGLLRLISRSRRPT